MELQTISALGPKPAENTDRTETLRKSAVALEASFLAEMLSFGGLGKGRDTFGGGEGEDAFANMLVQEQATLMAENGGIGLAEHIFTTLLRRESE